MHLGVDQNPNAFGGHIEGPKCIQSSGYVSLHFGHQFPDWNRLDNIFESWRGAAKLTEREAARHMSSVNGQGVTSCGCGGKCVTKQCTCVKEKVFCNSRCHKGNTKCENCDRTDLFLPDNLEQQLKKNEKSKKKSKKK